MREDARASQLTGCTKQHTTLSYVRVFELLGHKQADAEIPPRERHNVSPSFACRTPSSCFSRLVFNPGTTDKDMGNTWWPRGAGNGLQVDRRFFKSSSDNIEPTQIETQPLRLRASGQKTQGGLDVLLHAEKKKSSQIQMLRELFQTWSNMIPLESRSHCVTAARHTLRL